MAQDAALAARLQADERATWPTVAPSRPLTQSRLGSGGGGGSGGVGGFSSTAGAASWSALFHRATERVPNCRHGEPCKKQTVRKAGANQGRTFYSCQRAEGPRPEGNCGFFKWSTDWAAELKSKDAAKRKRDE